MGEDWKDEDDLLDKTDNTTTANGTFNMSTKDTSWKRLLMSEFLSALREKWFSSHEFPTSIWISNIKYRHSGWKHKSSFYSFNDQLDHTLTHYFPESKTTKDNVNKFWTDPLMAPFTKKLFYKILINGWKSYWKYLGIF